MRGGGVRRDAAAGLAPGSRVEIVPDAGHFLLVERPGPVNDLILSFLDGR